MACNSRTAVIFTAFFFAFGIPALAQSTATPSPAPSPIPDPCGSLISIVNRPAIGTGVCTVRTGHFDIETGYLNTTTTGVGGGNTVSAGATLVRFGTFDPHLDFEFTPPGYNKTTIGGAVLNGSNDIALGFKYELGYTQKALWGVNAQLTIPNGAPAFTAGNPQYTGNFNWAYTLNPTFGLSGTLGFNSLSGFDSAGSPASYFAFIPTVALTATLNDHSALFGEYAYFSHAGVGLPAKSVFDAGYLFDLGSHIQFDVEYGFSPTTINGQKQNYAGAGVSFMN